MRADSSGSPELTLPLSYVLNSGNGSFLKKARVNFISGGPNEVFSGDYVFKTQVMEYRPSHHKDSEPIWFKSVKEKNLPVFSILATVLLILFRNIFHRSFQKYFISFRTNYEIDFNLQKIGIPPLMLAIVIILLSSLDFFMLRNGSSTWFHFFMTLQVLFYPMAVSTAALFLFSLSLRFFPIIFPDIKVLFILAILLLAYNFTIFGLQEEIPDGIRFFLPALVGLFFILRSFLMFMILRKFFRYRSALSLFYICTLNLSTCLVLYEVLH
jgi:hypothetical protein